MDAKLKFSDHIITMVNKARGAWIYKSVAQGI